MYLFDFSSLPPSGSQSWISYFMWLACGWSQTRWTSVGSFFHGARRDPSRARGVFSLWYKKNKKKKALRWIPISVLIEYSTSTNYHEWLCVNWFGFFFTLSTFLLLPSSLYDLQNFTWSTVVCFSFSLSYLLEIHTESNSYILEHSGRIVISLCWKVEPLSSVEKKSEHIFLFFSTLYYNEIFLESDLKVRNRSESLRSWVTLC